MNTSRIARRAASIFPLIALLASAPVMAATTNPIPEPDILSLFALGGAVMVAIAIRKRRNKK
ncbi:MAG: PEP-CTERM sorting domain-containing protein [Hydrogenophilales bacterium]|nr:PEP-CTERM sorting domain-containing protein [Hydrogenophilales bacterium]